MGLDVRTEFVGVAIAVALCGAAGCTGSSTAPPTRSQSTSTPAPAALPAGTTILDCSDPIGIVLSPTGSYRNGLDVVGLDTTSTLQVTDSGGTDPHRLFAKTGLLVHAGHEATLTVPPDWADEMSVAWGNHAAEWTTALHIPACPAPPGGSGQWLVFPGGFSLDKAACVPLEVRAGNESVTVHISVGAPCPR